MQAMQYFYYLTFVYIFNTINSQVNINLIIFYINNSIEQLDNEGKLDYVGLPILMGLKKLQSQLPNIIWNYKLIYDTDECTSIYSAVNLASEYYENTKHLAVFGPPCSVSLDPVGRMTADWNIPIFTASAWNVEFNDKTFFPTLTRVSCSLTTLLNCAIELLKHFEWRNVAVIYDHFDSTANMMGSILIQSLRSDQSFYEFDGKINVNSTETKFIHILKDIRRNMRVIFLLTSNPEILQTFIQKAYDLGMTCEDYVYIVFKVATVESLITRKYKKATLQFLQLVLIIDDEPLPENIDVHNFIEDFRIASKFNRSVFWEDPNLYNELIRFAIGYHDAVLWYGEIVEKLLKENLSPFDGKEVARRMRNRVFKGIAGKTYINANGDHDCNYNLLDFDPMTKTFKVAMKYDGKVEQFYPIPSTELHWPGGSAPLNEPHCGYENNKCNKKGPISYSIILISLSVCLISVVIIILIIYKILKRRMELKSIWWLINFEDISLSKTKRNQTGYCKAKQFFDEVYIYKEKRIYMKCLGDSLTNIVTSDQVLCDLKAMRYLVHDNLNPFVGMVVKDSSVHIITLHCSKGSLEDALSLDETTWEWSFRYSFLRDIIEGMKYLHSSALKCHGNLTSRNCLLDSRFSIKITDYGLSALRKRKTDDNNSLLWVAPELLRNGSADGTQTGDVYSFAIIITEIITRDFPYGYSLPLLKKIEKIKEHSDPPYRPEIPENTCNPKLEKLVRECWEETPCKRPSFQEIKTSFLKIEGVRTGRNLLDSLIQRLEMHSLNLEKIIEERNLACFEEQRKTEFILNQLLPRVVTEQLKQGSTVLPEWFNKSTIFFSDIVGFTALSASYTPMQVVNFLNRLYSIFDAIIDSYDTYKVETIGDAYMVVSGIPVPNGDQHAMEIARMSMDIIQAVKQFKIKTCSQNQIDIRVGINSGPSMSAVVGVKMPRYCLFGMTVTIACKLESTGEPSKIQISETTKELLDQSKTFIMEYRDQLKLELKDLEEISTYWLLGEQKKETI